MCGLEDVGQAPLPGASLYDGANWWAGTPVFEPPGRAERRASGVTRDALPAGAAADGAEDSKGRGGGEEGGSGEGKDSGEGTDIGEGAGDGGGVEGQGPSGHGHGQETGPGHALLEARWLSMQYAFPLRALPQLLNALAALAAEPRSEVGAQPHHC